MEEARKTNLVRWDTSSHHTLAKQRLATDPCLSTFFIVFPLSDTLCSACPLSCDRRQGVVYIKSLCPLGLIPWLVCVCECVCVCVCVCV